MTSTQRKATTESTTAPPPPRRNLAPSEVSPNAVPPLHSHGECSMCRTDRRVCDGGRPCTRCVTYGFQCRDVRKRGRPKKDQDDPSLAVKHPLFNEWSLGGGAKPTASAEPRKKRRQAPRSAGTSAVPLPSTTNRQTSAAPLHPGPKKKPVAAQAPPSSSTPSPSPLPAQQQQQQQPQQNYASQTPTPQKKNSLDIASLLSRPQDEDHYPSSTFFADSHKQNDPYSSYYPPQQDSRADFYRQQTQDQQQPQPQPQQQQPSQPPQLYPPYHHKRMMIEKYRYPPPTTTSDIPESLDQQLQRYREQYRQLHPKRGQPTNEPDPYSAYQQPPPQQDYPLPKMNQPQNSSRGTTEHTSMRGGEEQVFPFMNCLQELMKVTNDLKPSSVVVKEEVICVDSVEGSSGSKGSSKAAGKVAASDKSGLSASFAGSAMQPPSPPHLHYRSASFPSFSSVHAPLHHHQQQQQQQQQNYYYPHHSSGFTQGLGLSDEPEHPQHPQQLHPQHQEQPLKPSYHPYGDERRSAWDFSSGGNSVVFDRPPPHVPPVSPSPYSGVHLPPSPAQSSTLLRLLSYEQN